MPRKNTKKWLQKGIASISALLLICVQFFLQFYLIHNLQGKNLVFESSKEIIDQSFWGETRKTSDGNIIKRFYTEGIDVPYLDFLILGSFDGKNISIPLLGTTQFLQKFIYIPKEFSALKEFSSFHIKVYFFLFSLLCIGMFLFQRTGFRKNIKRSFFLLYYQLSRNKNLFYILCRLRL